MLEWKSQRYISFVRSAHVQWATPRSTSIHKLICGIFSSLCFFCSGITTREKENKIWTPSPQQSTWTWCWALNFIPVDVWLLFYLTVVDGVEPQENIVENDVILFIGDVVFYMLEAHNIWICSYTIPSKWIYEDMLFFQWFSTSFFYMLGLWIIVRDALYFPIISIIIYFSYLCRGT